MIVDTLPGGTGLTFQGVPNIASGNLALNVSTAVVTGTLMLGSGGIIAMPHTNDVLA